MLIDIKNIKRKNKNLSYKKPLQKKKKKNFEIHLLYKIYYYINGLFRLNFILQIFIKFSKLIDKTKVYYKISLQSKYKPLIKFLFKLTS
jgi:hypothetical protein